MKKKSTPVRIALVLLGALLMAVCINTFIRAGGILPGGFSGISLLVQEIALKHFGIRIPFTVLNYSLNAIPAIFCFKFIGKKFTLYSVLFVAVSSLLTDFMPPMFVDFLKTHDVLLCSIFGGFLSAFSGVLCLSADATGGGTDFIAIYISEKYRRDAWNYIFAGNCVILAIAAIFFGLDRALYSIIFQFTTTLTLAAIYKAYQQRTLIIITNKAPDVYAVIQSVTNHGATAIDGLGYHEKKQRVVLYSVVNASMVGKLISEIRKTDENAFINVIKTEQINGRFYQKPKD